MSERQEQHTIECFEQMQRAQLAREEYLKAWPNYCRECGGSGFVTVHDRISGEPDADMCDCIREDQCPRCGGELDSDPWVCFDCGYDWPNDESLPPEPDCTCGAVDILDRVGAIESTPMGALLGQEG